MEPPRYSLRSLRTFEHPDFHDEVFHLIRPIGSSTACEDDEVLKMTAEERIVSILDSLTVRAFPVFNLGFPPRPAVCFTEASVAQLEWLIGEEGHYLAWGVGFKKDAVFQRGGGPVLEVRGDQWEHVKTWPEHLQAMTKRMWPGAYAADETRTVEFARYTHLATQSEWGFEREWRIPLQDFTFTPDDVSRLIFPDNGAAGRVANELDHRGKFGTAARVRNAPRFVASPAIKLK